jgi:hypothetical protein
MRNTLAAAAISVAFALLACSGHRAPPPTPETPPPPVPDAATAPDAPAPAPDAAAPPASDSKLHYLSDCSLTHPIARNPCSGTTPTTRGLASCSSLQIAAGQACGVSSPGCYVEVACPDGRTVAADYLVCAETAPSRCMTRSSRRYKRDIEYLAPSERAALARAIEALPLARFRYDDQQGGEARLGFLVEDAPAAPFVTADGRTVDLYALLAASIAAIQAQDQRIRVLERRLEECGTPPRD